MYPLTIAAIAALLYEHRELCCSVLIAMPSKQREKFLNFCISLAEVLLNESMVLPATKSKNGLYPAKGKFTGMVREDYLKMVVINQLFEIHTKVPAAISLKRGTQFYPSTFKKIAKNLSG